MDETLVPAVTGEAGEVPREARLAAVDGGALSEPLAEFSRKVRADSSMISAREIVDMRASGLSVDAVFEITVASAVGAGRGILAAGLAALRTPGK